jgi:DNA-binding IscR family transcriptional regulator
VEVLEGDCIVDCVKTPSACPRISICTSHDIWAFLDEKISETLRSITLEQWLTELERKRRASLKSAKQTKEKIRKIR